MPTPDRRTALLNLYRWATSNRRSGSPYKHPEVKAARRALGDPRGYDLPNVRPRGRIAKALYELSEWSTSPARHGNPHSSEAVQNANFALGGDGFDLPGEGSMKRNARGIYHEAGLSRGDFVIHPHPHPSDRGRFLVHRVDAGGTHTMVSPHFGEPTIQAAIRRIRQQAHLRDIKKFEFYAQIGNELRWIGDDATGMEEQEMIALQAEYLGQEDALAGREPLWYRTGASYLVHGRIGNPVVGAAYVRAYNAARKTMKRNPAPPPPPRRQRPRPPSPGRRALPAPRKSPASVLSSVRRMSEERSFDPEASYPRDVRPHHFSVNPSNESRDEIVTGAARAFFVSAWANAAEEAGHSFSGGTILDDVAPETPEEVLEFARGFITSVENVNQGKSIDSLYREHEKAAESDEADPESFGWYIAMPAMGHGVHWYDEFPAPPSGEIILPPVEFHVEVDPDDIDSATVSWAEISERLAR